MSIVSGSTENMKIKSINMFTTLKKSGKIKTPRKQEHAFSYWYLPGFGIAFGTSLSTRFLAWFWTLSEEGFTDVSIGELYTFPDLFSETM